MLALLVFRFLGELFLLCCHLVLTLARWFLEFVTKDRSNIRHRVVQLAVLYARDPREKEKPEKPDQQRIEMKSEQPKLELHLDGEFMDGLWRILKCVPGSSPVFFFLFRFVLGGEFRFSQLSFFVSLDLSFPPFSPLLLLPHP